MTPSRKALTSPSVKRIDVAHSGQVTVRSRQASSRPYIVIALPSGVGSGDESVHPIALECQAQEQAFQELS